LKNFSTADSNQSNLYQSMMSEQSLAPPWRRLRAIRWSVRMYREALRFLRSGETPDRLQRRVSRTRFLENMKWFEAAGNRIVLRYAGRTWVVIPRNEVEKLLARAYSDIKANAFRGVREFFQRV